MLNELFLLKLNEVSLKQARTGDPDPLTSALEQDFFQQTATNLSALIKACPLAVYAVDPEGIVKIWNPSAERIFGWNEGEVIGKILPIVQPEMAEEFKLLRKSLLETAQRGLFLRRRKKDGTLISLNVSSAPILNAQGEAIGIMAVAAEMSDHEAELAQLKDRWEFTEQMVESSFDVITAFDDQMRYILWNPAAEKVMGIGKKDALGKKIDEVFPFDKATEIFAHARAVLQGQSVMSTGKDFVNPKTGETVAYEARYLPIRNASGLIRGGLCISKDISSYEKLERKLGDYGTTYQILFELNPQPMIIYDCESFRFLSVNPAALEKYGYSKEEFLQLTIFDIRPKEDVARLKERLDFRPRGLNYYLNSWTHLKKDGQLMDVSVVSSDFEFQGRPARMIAVKEINEPKKSSSPVSLVRSAEEEETPGKPPYETLVSIGRVLKSPLDLRSLLGHVSQLLVPAEADLCFIDLLEANGTLLRQAIAHRDGEIERVLAATSLESTVVDSSDNPLVRMLREERMLFIASLNAREFADLVHLPTDYSGLPIPQPRACVVAPLIFRGKVYGSLTLCRNRPFEIKDQPWLEDVCGRIAGSLENFRLRENLSRKI